MEKSLMILDDVLEQKIPTIVDAIKEADPTTEEYSRLLTNFNSSMVIYSELKTLFIKSAEKIQENLKGENNDGINN